MAMSYFSTSSSSLAKQCTYGKLAYVASPEYRAVLRSKPVLTLSIAILPSGCWTPATGGKVISRAKAVMTSASVKAPTHTIGSFYTSVKNIEVEVQNFVN